MCEGGGGGKSVCVRGRRGKGVCAGRGRSVCDCVP